MPVQTMSTCSSSIGGSVNNGWQIMKGNVYAAIFGYITQVCGVNYANDSRVATLILLFLFSMWAKYCISPTELMTKKNAAGICATILISQLNYTQDPLFAWRILATSVLGAAIGIVASCVPFPASALKEVEERHAHALLQTAHLFGLLVEAFSCESQGQMQARMLYTRITHSLARLQTNRVVIKQRFKDSADEFPTVAFHFLFGTVNNYTLKRLREHTDTLDMCFRYLRAMSFAITSLPFDEFHNSAVQHMRAEMAAVSLELTRWVQAVSAATRRVHRAELLREPLVAYARAVKALFDSYVHFRADMFFNGRLFLVDTLDGNKALLRHRCTPNEEALGQPHTAAIALTSAVALRPHDVPASSDALSLDMLRAEAEQPAGSAATSSAAAVAIVPPVLRQTSQSTPHVRFHDISTAADDDDAAPAHAPAPTSPGAPSQPILTSSSSSSDHDVISSSSPYPSGSHPQRAGHLPTSDPSGPSPPLLPPSPSVPRTRDFTWTSDDVLSLNFFLFQINEFTKSTIKLAAEPGEQEGADTDPIARYHFGALSDVPQFVWRSLCKAARSQRDSFVAVWRWDARVFSESVKLALAICLAAANELTPRDWPPIYPRLTHGWWAPVTVAFTMADSVGAHVTTMSLRALGTMVGAVLGYLAAAICADNLVALVAVLTLVNAVCAYSRSDAYFSYAYLVCGLTSIVVAVGRDPAYGPVSDFAFVRIEQTLIGVIIGMVVHNLILPLKASTLLQEELMRNITRIQHAFAYSFGRYQQRAGHTPMTTPAASKQTAGENQDGAPVGRQQTCQVELTSVLVEAQSVSSAPHPHAPPVGLNKSASVQLLLPEHAYHVLGPQLHNSLDVQLSLCGASADEVRLWRPPFPSAAYTALVDLQRTIVLFLFCMDLSLQRILQSDSRYLMPDLEHIFSRIRHSVAHSMRRVSRALEAEMGDAHTHTDTSHGVDAAHSAHTADPADSLLSGATGLASLHAELEELDAHYKRWIDERVLARRSELSPAASPPCAHDAVHAAAASLTTATASVPPLPSSLDLPLQTIPMFTPQLRPHRMDATGTATDTGTGTGTDTGTGSGARPTHSLPLHPLDLSHDSYGRGVPAAAAPSLPVPTTASAGVSASDSTVPNPVSTPPLRVSVPAAATAPLLSDLSLASTFTRCMDVLALNTFLYATRGLVREMMALSQAVRVLMHMRKPDTFEAEF